MWGKDISEKRNVWVNLFIFSKNTGYMSHGKERKEKNCLNCNARVFGRYCHVCGQENIEPKESAWELVVHFFNDITHFEGKFGKAIRYVLFRPGFLPAEYARGRRMSYMNPVRMYVFTSAFFFIIFSYQRSHLLYFLVYSSFFIFNFLSLTTHLLLCL